MQRIFAFDQSYAGYARDESRTAGWAESISFPTSVPQVQEILAELAKDGVGQVTVQGARTGLAAGAVPFGGHVLNLSRMQRVRGMRRLANGRYTLTVEPGVVLLDLRQDLQKGTFDTTGWTDQARELLAEAYASGPLFFPTDPTETSATIGGMVACNASGARSYRFGSMRRHVAGLEVVLATGELLHLHRGQVFESHGTLELTSDNGRTITVDVPTYTMPNCKNASGYFAKRGMDAIDLFIGSDGTLGVITAIELELMRPPAHTWGVSCFFSDEKHALSAVEALKQAVPEAMALEYFDGDALTILARERLVSPSFAAIPAFDPAWQACVFVELAADTYEQATEALAATATALEAAGGSAAASWVGRSDVDRERLRLMRHAIPEAVNLLIDERRKVTPTITKLGSDMAVPDGKLFDVMALYRETLAREGLQSAIWGHIGNNHLHVNILPRDDEEFARGKELFREWAQIISSWGGSVSAEHGVGKIKRDFLVSMYGTGAVAEMAVVKRQLDPHGLLGRGNLFDEQLL